MSAYCIQLLSHLPDHRGSGPFYRWLRPWLGFNTVHSDPGHSRVGCFRPPLLLSLVHSDPGHSWACCFRPPLLLSFVHSDPGHSRVDCFRPPLLRLCLFTYMYIYWLSDSLHCYVMLFISYDPITAKYLFTLCLASLRSLRINSYLLMEKFFYCNRYI